MKKIMIFIICFAAGICYTNVAMSSSLAKITVRVIDEANAPIAGANVFAYFMHTADSGIGLKSDRVNGFTDSKGSVTFQGDGMNSIGVTADKEGYYQSGSGYEFKSSSFLLNRWEPWNPTIEVVMKKKRNPVAMIGSGGIIKLPLLDSPVGYDLEKGDWVAPYGLGATSDFIFNFHAVSRAYSDYECNFTLTFSNDGDGIQEYYFDDANQSIYKWPFMAPESGYIPKLYKGKSDGPQSGFKSNEKKNVHYIYRVRTRKDKNGNIVAANYGILRKEFELGPNGTILFGSLFNPDGTRNLEEDPSKNLFKKK